MSEEERQKLIEQILILQKQEERGKKKAKYKKESDVFYKKISSLVRQSAEDVKQGYNYPSRTFIDMILLPADVSIDDLISEIIKLAQDENRNIHHRNKKYALESSQGYFKTKSSFPQLEKNRYIKWYLFSLIRILWAEINMMSDIDHSAAKWNNENLIRMKKRLIVADDLIDTLIRLNLHLGRRPKGQKVSTANKFVQQFKTQVTSLAEDTFFRHLEISSLSIKLIWPELKKGVSAKSISQKKWRNTKRG